MKPLYIEISAFGPYAECEKIDFTKLGTNGLYLISGETGAGKTTIFDAISYALYGRASGKERKDNMLRSDFASAETTSYIKFKFEYKGKVYDIERYLSYERPKLRGSGIKREQGTAEIIMPNNTIVSGIEAVKQKVEEIIGINHEQFAQTVMIAQGEFLRLLLSNTTERSAILRRIFDTERFKYFQEQLKLKSNTLEKELDEEKRSFRQYLNGVVCDEKYPFYEEFNETLNSSGVCYQSEKLLSEFKELLIWQDNSVKKMRVQYEMTQREYIGLTTDIAVAKDINKKFEELSLKESEFENHQANKGKTEEKQILLTKGIVALRKIKQYEERYIATQKAYDELLKNIDFATKENADAAETLEKAEVLFNKECNKKDEKIKLNAEIKNLEDQMPKYRSLSELCDKIKEKSDNINKSEQITEKQKKEREIKEKERLESAEELSTFSDIETEAEKVNQKKAIKTETLLSLNKLNQTAAEIETKKKKLSDAQKKYIESEKIFEKKDAVYKSLENLFFREQAGILASLLVDGEPCPVCGAYEHPNPAILSTNAPSESDVKAAQEEVEKARIQKEKAANYCSNLNTDAETSECYFFDELKKYIPESNAVAIENAKNEIVMIQKSLGDEIDSTENEAKVLKKKIARKEECRKFLSVCEKEINELTDKINCSQEELNSLKIQLSALDGEYQSLKKELVYSDKKEIEKALEQVKIKVYLLNKNYESAEKKYNAAKEMSDTKRTILDEKLSQKEKLKEEYSRTNEKYHLSLTENGFLNESGYHEVLLTEKQIEKLSEEIDKYNRTSELLWHDVARLRKETEDKKIANLIEMQKRYDFLKDLSSGQQELISSMQSDINTNVNIYKKLKEAAERIVSREALYADYKELSDTANGEINGKGKISFEVYLQVRYFNRILNAANVHLSDMTNRRYKLKRRDEQNEALRNKGLELDVVDFYTGKERDVRSLSGGESFKASLSLALGMSDIVQQTSGGVQLDTMFIDEGFGLLDAESLDISIAALQSIASSNRIIGIISHVSELDSRIEKQIKIKKSTNGSKINIIS